MKKVCLTLMFVLLTSGSSSAINRSLQEISWGRQSNYPLDGKRVFVKLFPEWRERPDAYQLRSVTVKESSFTLNRTGLPPDTSFRISIDSAPSPSASQDIIMGSFGPSASYGPGIKAAEMH